MRANLKIDLAPETSDDEVREGFAADVLAGLAAPRKTLPCRYFYDARGSELFEEITRLPEYYPTETEKGILRENVEAFARDLEGPCLLVEFGSGSSVKTEILIEALPELVAYVPIDVSGAALDDAACRLASRFPDLPVHPVVGDFCQPMAIPAELAHLTPVGFFPGSTIGNFAPKEAEALLAAFRATLTDRGRLLIGADLRKDVQTLINAYDDSAGVTAAFNLNLLARINRELDGDFDLAHFRHKVRYDLEHGRIEMHIASTRDQVVHVRGRAFRFKAGETIHTENSHKFTLEQFGAMAARAGWDTRRVWTDDRQWFSVHDLVAA